jgi:hypothetical protein
MDKEILEGHYARKQIGCSSRLISWSHQRRFQAGLELTAPLQGKLVLDYGCGDGTFLAMWAAAAGTALWMRWRPGLHLAAFSLIIWLVPIGFFILDRHAHWLVALIGVLLAAAAIIGRQDIDRHVPASAAVFAYAIVTAYAALFIMQFVDSRWFYSEAHAGSLGRLVLLAAISGHVIGQGEIVSIYERKAP